MYELHKLTANYPMSFRSYLLNNAMGITPHWHENIELIHITKGNARAFLDSKEVLTHVGDTLIVNTNTIHQVISTSGVLTYHCLIMSIEFLKQMGLDFTNTYISSCVNDDNITLLFSNIAQIMENRPLYYKPESFSLALQLATLLLRDYGLEKPSEYLNKNNTKTEMVKKSITYLKKNFDSQITLENICEEMGLSKYYFCHTFKEVTGITFSKMLNFIRCQEAKRILMNYGCNIQETAYRCGFTNMSYFSKTYRNIMGHLPSDIKKEQQGNGNQYH